MIVNNYLERSHVSYSGRFILKIYLTVATIILAVVIGINLFTEPTVEIVNGLPFATEIPGLGCSATTNVSRGRGRLGQSIRFARLIPVPDHPEPDTKPEPEAYSFLHDFKLPISYYRIFSERDLMVRLEMGTNYYTIY